MRAPLRLQGFNGTKIGLMREHGLQPKIRRRDVTAIDSDRDQPGFSNRAQEMVLNGPDQLWVADVAYVAIAAGFFYVAVILDARSRRVVSYAISRFDRRPR